jgi:2-keto-4-pentenoate hydratase/2-oxohepta-3-ene-1,7-dioic acid hydratase in catechol pathway
MTEWGFWIKTPDTYADKKKTQILVPGENQSSYCYNLAMVWFIEDVIAHIGENRCLVK